MMEKVNSCTTKERAKLISFFTFCEIEKTSLKEIVVTRTSHSAEMVNRYGVKKLRYFMKVFSPGGRTR